MINDNYDFDCLKNQGVTITSSQRWSSMNTHFQYQHATFYLQMFYRNN